MKFNNHKTRHRSNILYPGILVGTADKNTGQLITNISLTGPGISSNGKHSNLKRTPRKTR